LAQPPDITETFVREVDENLRRDRARDFGKKYAGWMIAAVVLFLAASGGWIYWQNYRAQQSELAVDQLAQIYTALGKGQVGTAPARLDVLSKDRSDAIRASALFGRAAVALQQNDTKLATAKFREIVADSSLPQAFRDLALIRQTALEFDALKPDQVIARLAPLAKADSPWFGSAGEMTAMALIKQGKTAQAAQLFAEIAKNKEVPDQVRARSVQMASSLGVDVANVMPQIAQ
jgi:hypothetical protein